VTWKESKNADATTTTITTAQCFLFIQSPARPALLSIIHHNQEEKLVQPPRSVISISIRQPFHFLHKIFLVSGSFVRRTGANLKLNFDTESAESPPNKNSGIIRPSPFSRNSKLYARRFREGVVPALDFWTLIKN